MYNYLTTSTYAAEYNNNKKRIIRKKAKKSSEIRSINPAKQLIAMTNEVYNYNDHQI